jgi:large subunit ribosomal protein L24
MVSKQPRKQHLAIYAAPLHRRHRFLSAPLSRELRGKYRTRSLPVRKGDRVRVVVGDFKKLEGDVLEVDTKRRRIQIHGATTTKADGTQVPRPLVPSNVVLIKLASDKERDRVLEGRSKGGKEGAK